MNKEILLLRKIARLGKLEKLVIKGFKSYRSVEIDFPTKTTIVIGANGSGKTALIEAFELLRSMIDYYIGRVPNPLAKWWGFKNISWNHRSEPIEITIYVNYKGDPTRVKPIIEETIDPSLEYEKKFLTNFFGRPVNIMYSITLLSNKWKLEAYDKIILNDSGVELLFEPPHVKIILDKKFFQILKEKIIEKEKEVQTKFSEVSREEQSIFKRWLFDLIQTLDELIDKEGLTLIITNFGFRSSLELFINSILKNIELGITLSNAIELLEDTLFDNISSKVYARIVKEEVDIADKSKSLKNIYRMFEGIIQTHLVETFEEIVLSIVLISSFIEGIITIKHIDISRLSQPQLLTTTSYLKVDDENFVSILYNIGKGRLAEELCIVLKELWGIENVSGYFEPTPDGRVVFKLVVDGLELLPPNIPAGVWKILLIETALMLEPTVLLIDEFENSLHVKAQEYLLNEIREHEVFAIIATHSPTLVDLAKSLDEILILEYTGLETKATRLRKVDELRKKLEELGLTPSEALLYGFIGKEH